MKKVISILAGCAVALSAFAGEDIDMPSPFVFSAVPTNTSAVTTSSGAVTSAVPLSAWVDTVIVDVGGGGGTPTSTVTVATMASMGTGPARTLLTLTDVAADAVYPVRDLVTTQAGVDIANTPARSPLVDDRLIVSAYGANTTTNTVTVYVILSNDP